jgi:SAM-dependent methyltransferase
MRQESGLGTGADAVSPFDDGEIYDRIMGELDYAVDFYVGLARQTKGPILDVACGTGRIMIPMLQAGADVEGLDNAPSMLERLRVKARALGMEPNLYQADMSDFSLSRRYALVAITFNAFTNMLSTEKQIACLRCCRESLAPGGMFVFDGFFPSLEMVGAAQNTRVMEAETRDAASGETWRIYDTRSFDRVRQIQHSVNEIEATNAAGRTRLVQRSEMDLRWTYKFEMELLLRVAGFSKWEIAGGFDRRPLEKESDGMVVFAWG